MKFELKKKKAIIFTPQNSVFRMDVILFWPQCVDIENFWLDKNILHLKFKIYTEKMYLLKFIFKCHLPNVEHYFIGA